MIGTINDALAVKHGVDLAWVEVVKYTLWGHHVMICIHILLKGLTFLNDLLSRTRLPGPAGEAVYIARDCDRLCNSVRQVRQVASVLVLLGAMLCHASLLASESDAASQGASDDVTASQLSIVQKPRWELGIGGGYFSGFDYPASSDTNERAIAVPFFVYRTPLLRFGGGGLRAVAIENPRMKLDLAIGGSLNASSKGNSARDGMPDLDFLFELGPQLEVRLFDHQLESGGRLKGRFTSELRAVFSTDFGGVDARGLVADIGVGVNIVNIAGSGVTFITGLDVSFASERLQDYFYEVDPEFVTESRAQYDAGAGYLESTLFLGLAFRPLPKVRVFTGIIQGFYDGASNQDSPLFDVTEQTRYAVGVVWTIKSSRQMIDVVDLGSDD